MESIEVTQQQADRLIEMCKVLFPEFDTVEFDITKQYDGSDHHIYFVDTSMSIIGDYIHWFEFCMTHLVNKLYYPDNQVKRDTRSKVEYFFFQTFINKI